MWSSIILLIAAGLFVLTVLVIIIYLFYYRSVINRRIADPAHTEKKRLWSPMRVCLTTVISALATLAVIGIIFSILSPATPSQVIPATYHAQFLSLEKMREGYLSQYSAEENPGYTKAEEIIGDVKYTYFITTEGADAFHPAFLIYAEYVGEGTPKYHDASASFKTLGGEEQAGIMVSGCEIGGTVCIVGNSFADCTISCIVDFYDEQKEEFNLEQLQEENTPLTLQCFCNGVS